jgi:secondary thiamine-phosphate synthase enzyme
MSNLIKVNSSLREEMIEITGRVEECIPSESSGICVVFVQHTTCGVTVNENADPDVQTDMMGFLRRLIPQFPTKENHPADEASSPLQRPPRSQMLRRGPRFRKEGSFFRHAEENSDAHIKSSLVGASVTIPFENGRLSLGRWQGVYLCEFDGPRERKVVVQVVGT